MYPRGGGTFKNLREHHGQRQLLEAGEGRKTSPLLLLRKAVKGIVTKQPKNRRRDIGSSTGKKTGDAGNSIKKKKKREKPALRVAKGKRTRVEIIEGIASLIEREKEE